MSDNINDHIGMATGEQDDSLPPFDSTCEAERAYALTLESGAQYAIVSLKAELKCRERQLRESYALVSSLRSQLEAKDKEIAGLSAQVERKDNQRKELFAEVYKLDRALSTAERDAIKKALEAVKGERVSRHDELVAIHGQTPLSAEDTVLWPYTSAIINAESAILALLPKESVS